MSLQDSIGPTAECKGTANFPTRDEDALHQSPALHDGNSVNGGADGITSASSEGRQAGGVPTGTGICSRHLDLRCEQLRTEYDLSRTGERAIVCNLPAVLVCEACGALCAECAEVTSCIWSEHKEAANV